MTQKFSLLFPGQGSQSLGMLSGLLDDFGTIKETFAQASEVLGYDLWALTQDGPDEKLNQTEYTQPALLAADVATWRCWLEMNGAMPAYLAGHSLGEYAALVCAESLSFEDGIRLVAARGQYMQAAVPAGKGAMAAVIGLGEEAVQALCEEASSFGVVAPANYNSVGQIVVAGEVAAVDQVVAVAKSAGARMATKIPVSVPSHCILMQPAADKMAVLLSEISFHTPKVPVIQNADVQAFDAPEAIRDALIRQLVAPVRWVETIQFISNQGISEFFECGPGKVLAGLNKRISKSLVTHPLHSKKDIAQAIEIAETV